MKHVLHIVTGAPGAGKSTTVAAFLGLDSEYVAFDIDWLIDATSELAGKDIHVEESTWKPYGALWFEVLRAIYRNGRVPVFFAPIDPSDIERYGQPEWCAGIEWLLLDCDDAIRSDRLKQRPGWTDAMVVEAIRDADFLRQVVPQRLDTGTLLPDAAAAMIRDWLGRGRERFAPGEAQGL